MLFLFQTRCLHWWHRGCQGFSWLFQAWKILHHLPSWLQWRQHRGRGRQFLGKGGLPGDEGYPGCPHLVPTRASRLGRKTGRWLLRIGSDTQLFPIFSTEKTPRSTAHRPGEGPSDPEGARHGPEGVHQEAPRAWGQGMCFLKKKNKCVFFCFVWLTCFVFKAVQGECPRLAEVLNDAMSRPEADHWIWMKIPRVCTVQKCHF